MEISKEAWEFAQAAFEDAVANLLDDPSDLLPPLLETTVAEEFAWYRKLAKDFGYEFDELVIKLGSPYEIERLNKIEASGTNPAE